MYKWPGFCIRAIRRALRSLLASSIIMLTTPAIVGGSVALVQLCCRKWLPSDNFFALCVIMVMGIIDLSVLAFFSAERLLLARQYLWPRSLAPSFCLFFSASSFSTEYLPRHSLPAHLQCRNSSPLGWTDAQFPAGDASPTSQPLSATFLTYPLRRILNDAWWKWTMTWLNGSLFRLAGSWNHEAAWRSERSLRTDTSGDSEDHQQRRCFSCKTILRRAGRLVAIYGKRLSK